MLVSLVVSFIAIFIGPIPHATAGDGSAGDCKDEEVSKLTVDRSEDSNEWLVVEFSRCASADTTSLNTSAIQINVARWMNEECATAINCCLKEALRQENIVVGEKHCSEGENFISLLAVKEHNFPPGKGNTIGAQLLGAVIRSREHILSTLVHSDLKSITVRRMPSEKASNFRYKRVSLISIILTSTFVLLCLSAALFVVLHLLRGRSSRNHIHSHIAIRSSFS